MDERSARLTSDDLYAASVDRSIKELQRMVSEHEEALNRLREAPTPQPPRDVSSVVVSLDVMKTAYQDAAKAEPFLPFPGSVLPALLAMRKTHQIIVESQAYLATQKVSLEKTKKRLETEQANLADQRLLQNALQDRIESLRDGLETRMEMTPEQVAKQKLDEAKQKKRDFDKDTSKLLKGLNTFIDNHLGAMLAAEDLGGPVVGDMMDIDTDDLAVGFSAQGRVKKSKPQADQDKRQRRIDDIWGEPSHRDQSKAQHDEAAAAGAEMRELMEELLNSLMEAEGDSSAAYVRIARESAATRFLVRSKVAQFHPKDATRLRLVDFGRELDD